MHGLIDGNIKAVIQVKTTSQDDIGEDVEIWNDSIELWGWLDLLGAFKSDELRSWIKDATNVFVCDYVALPGITERNSRLICNGKIYNIEYIDNPMEMAEDSQTEIYLRFLGWQ